MFNPEINSFNSKTPECPPPSPSKKKATNTTAKVADAAAHFITPGTPRSNKIQSHTLAAKKPEPPLTSARLPMPVFLSSWAGSDEKLELGEELIVPFTPAKITKSVRQDDKSKDKIENPIGEASNKTSARSLFGDDEATAMDEKRTADTVRQPPAPKESPFSILHTSLEGGTFTYKESVCEVTKFDSGTYFTVYELTKTPDLLVKAYHGHTDLKFYTRQLNELLENSLQNLHDIKEKCKLPVADLVNKDTAVTDMFFIQKKIPHKIDISNPAHIMQAANFFAASVREGVMMDLQPQNLRVTEDGTVVLIDFVEEPQTVAIFIKLACRAWVDHCKKCRFTEGQSRKLLTTLTASFIKTRGHFTKAWLEEILIF